MARLLPSKPDPDAPPSEKRIFELFAETLPHTTTVLHGRRLVLPADGTHTQKNCEIDFLVLDPDRGILVLEVKGGEVRRDASTWTSVDRNNVEHEIKDPARQAHGELRTLQAATRSIPLATINPLPPGIRFGDTLASAVQTAV